jgi:hypothetical protein
MIQIKAVTRLQPKVAHARRISNIQVAAIATVVLSVVVLAVVLPLVNSASRTGRSLATA